MNERPEKPCPECDELSLPNAGVDRRRFFSVLGAGVAAGIAARQLTLPSRTVAAEPATTAKPAESLIKELFSTISDAQRKTVALPYEHGAGKGKLATRLGMYNSAVQNHKIGEYYSKAQQDLIHRIVKSLSSGEDGYHRISREGTWDASGTFENCGCHIFGDPTDGKPFAWMFTGHHLTMRCDGNAKDGIAWGGPVYYGHTPHGYNEKNVFFFQTKRVLEAFEALDGKQREKAIVVGSPGEQAASVKFRKEGEAKPGLALAELSKDQQGLIEKVMRDLLSPYRKEDGDEIMAILKNNGGLDKLHLAFYRDKDAEANERWHFWRLEGPGFVWNYRVLPHVHCFVNIANAGKA